jgi:hypothetical protein
VNKKYELVMPTERTSDISEYFADDDALFKKVMTAIERNFEKDDKYQKFPNFLVFLDQKEDQKEFLRRMRNCVSNVVNSSQWPYYAHQYKNFKKDIFEPAACLVNYEKDAEVKTTRIWLIFPEELKMIGNQEDFTNIPLTIKNVEGKDIVNPDLKAKIDKTFIIKVDTWYTRIVNLQKWAKMTTSQIETVGIRMEAYLPFLRKSEQTICLQWIIAQPVASSSSSSSSTSSTSYKIIIPTEDECMISDIIRNNDILLGKVYNKLEEMRKELTTSVSTTSLDFKSSIISIPISNPKDNRTDQGTVLSPVERHRDNMELHSILKSFIQKSIKSSNWSEMASSLSLGDTDCDALYQICFDPVKGKTFIWLVLPSTLRLFKTAHLSALMSKEPNWELQHASLLQWNVMEEEYKVAYSGSETDFSSTLANEYERHHYEVAVPLISKR